MKRAVALMAGVVVLVAIARLHAAPPSANLQPWNARAAAAYLDGRAAWWIAWPTAARDHDTACVSCHTVVPYALARSALRSALDEHAAAAPEQAILAGVVKRVTLWREVEPFYPDQTRGLPKTSESRGTEAVLNALILAARDRRTGALAGETRTALANLWQLQFKAGELKGAWAWLNFHYEPWESSNAAFFGAAMAALAAGMAPGDYAAAQETQANIGLLRGYIRDRIGSESLFNRLTALWASRVMSDLLAPGQTDAIVADTIGAQQADGGWSMARLGSWRRLDSTALDGSSDGYATGLAVLALGHGRSAAADRAADAGREWLARHQDPATGAWNASSLNKQRDPATDAGKFMTDAATAFAVLALNDPEFSRP